MEDTIFESSSSIIEFLVFGDRLNGLYRFNEEMSPMVDEYLAKYNSAIESYKAQFKTGPETYEIGGITFTRKEALLGLDFEGNYSGGSGNDSDFFPRYFYSSVIILSLSLIESLVKDLVTSVEKTALKKWKPDNNPTLISLVNYLNANGYPINLYETKKEYVALNEVRNHFIHFIHRESWGLMNEAELKKINPTHERAKESLLLMSRIARCVEEGYIKRS